MDSIITALKDTPIPTIMVVAGIGFLLIAVVGQLTGRIAVAAERKRSAVIIGGGLLALGMALHIVPVEISPSKPQGLDRELSDRPLVDPAPPHPTDSSSDPLVAIDEILATLPLANLAFNVPATLHLGRSAIIQLFLSMQHSIEQLQARISAVGEREGTHIRISPQMEARLSGVGFKIEAVTSEVQLVSEREITEWKWEIEPTRAGRQYLHLTLSAILHVGSNGGRRTVRTFERIIEVSEVIVPWPQRVAQFVKDNWQWL